MTEVDVAGGPAAKVVAERALLIVEAGALGAKRRQAFGERVHVRAVEVFVAEDHVRNQAEGRVEERGFDPLSLAGLVAMADGGDDGEGREHAGHDVGEGGSDEAGRPAVVIGRSEDRGHSGEAHRDHVVAAVHRERSLRAVRRVLQVDELRVDLA